MHLKCLPFLFVYEATIFLNLINWNHYLLDQHFLLSNNLVYNSAFFFTLFIL